MFGGIDCSTGGVFMIPVEDRKKDTLLNIIKDWILPGTTIVSDCFKSYDCLKDEGYRHLSVNHKVTYKDPETGACTNTIEGEWRHAKASLPGYHRKKEWYPQYLAKYMFRRMCRIKRVDPMETFFYAAGRLYNSRDTTHAETEDLSPVLSDEEVQEEIEISNNTNIDNYFE